jgi:hypothetical protein
MNETLVGLNHLNISNFTLVKITEATSASALSTITSYNAIKVTIGAENFGTLVKITDDQNICFIGTKGIKSILTQKFNPLEESI